MTTPNLPTVDETGRFQIVGCTFRPGDKRAYGYKIPAHWTPRIGQLLKVPDSRVPGAWKAVHIVELNQSLNPTIRYAWGRELMEPEDAERKAEREPNRVDSGLLMEYEKPAPLFLDDVPSPVPTPSIAERFQPASNVGGALIGKALAADLASPDPVSLRQPDPTPPEPAPPAPEAPTADFGSW